MEFLIDNLEAILAAVLGTQLLAQLVVNLTPTPRDDAAVAKFYRAVEVVAGIWSARAKMPAPPRLPEQIKLDL